jgi:hypothetical protein
MFTEHQLHILIGCADARDLSQLQVDAVGRTIEAYKAKNILADVRVIRTAGSFITPDIISDIKRTIEQHQRNDQEPGVPVSYYVHIQSHGHLTEDSSKNYISHVHDMKIVDGSPLNCGMLGATAVGVEIEKLILEESPVINIKGKDVVIDDDLKLRYLLREVYAHDGYLAGDWIRSIDLLRTHPRSQRVALQNAINIDADLRVLNIGITSGILDYSIHALIRVDGGDPKVPFWDDVQQYIRKHNSDVQMKKEILVHQSESQKPLAGLLCMIDPKMSSRVLAARYYYSLIRKDCGEEEMAYIPNTIFNMSGSAFDVPSIPFGPYVIAGFYYSVKYLNLTDQMVMGYDSHQTMRIAQKIKNDPIMNLVVEKYKVNLIHVNLNELAHLTPQPAVR